MKKNNIRFWTFICSFYFILTHIGCLWLGVYLGMLYQQQPEYVGLYYMIAFCVFMLIITIMRYLFSKIEVSLKNDNNEN